MSDSNDRTDGMLIGAWKLDHFRALHGEDIHNYNEIIIFSNRYYSDFQAERGESDVVNSHVGMYRIRGNAITIQIQLSNIKESIGKVASGTFSIEDDVLSITFSYGNQPGVWVYHRLE